MGEVYLPVLSHFQNKNVWIASEGRLRYKITPSEADLTAELWEGPWCYDLSTVEEQKAFSLSDEGIAALGTWLLERAAETNARPARSMAEDMARRGAKGTE